MTNKTAQASTCLNHLTSEYARPGHPDKLADQVSDAVLDAHLGLDPLSQVAVECLLKGNTCTLAGEITSRAVVDLPAVVSSVLGTGMTVISHITQQDCQIGGAVDHGGAGDMGHNPGTDLAQWCQYLNSIDWFARGFGCDGRLSFPVGALKETRISGSPGQQSRTLGHSIPLEHKQ